VKGTEPQSEFEAAILGQIASETNRGPSRHLFRASIAATVSRDIASERTRVLTQDWTEQCHSVPSPLDALRARLLYLRWMAKTVCADRMVPMIGLQQGYWQPPTQPRSSSPGCLQIHVCLERAVAIFFGKPRIVTMRLKVAGRNAIRYK